MVEAIHNLAGTPWKIRATIFTNKNSLSLREVGSVCSLVESNITLILIIQLQYGLLFSLEEHMFMTTMLCKNT